MFSSDVSPTEFDALLSKPGNSSKGPTGNGIARDFQPSSAARHDMRMNSYSPELIRAMEGVRFIAEHLKDEDDDEQVSRKPLTYLKIQCLFYKH